MDADPLRALAALAVPPRCGACGGRCAWREAVCGPCLRAVRAAVPGSRAIPGLDWVIGAVPYQGVGRDLVAALKFGPRPRLATVMAGTIGRSLEALGPPLGEAVVVPVPAAPNRLRRRGFDPAEAVAAALAVELDRPLARCLGRRAGRRQVGRSRGDRLAAPPRVSCAGPPPARAIVVDDVLTTGATLAACARALRAAGGVEIGAVAFALAAPGRHRPGPDST